MVPAILFDFNGVISRRQGGALPGIHTLPQSNLIPGVLEFVNRAGAQYLWTISTGSRRDCVDHALYGATIERKFEVVVSEDDVATDKPGPALYHATLTRLTAIDYTIGLD